MTTETRDVYTPSPHETEERLRLARRVANEGFWDWNLSTQTVYFDPLYYLMAGYAVDEFPHRLEEFQQRVHPDDQAEVMAIVQRSMKGQTCRCEAEFRFRKKAGDYLWILSKWLIAERDEQGKPLRLVGTHVDITERKQAEKALRASEELLSETARIAQVGGWEIDLEGNFLAWTEETFCIHELESSRPPSVDQAIAFYHPDDQPRVRAAVQRAIECGEAFDFEARLLTVKQNLRWVRAIGRVRYRDGRPSGIHGTLQDITERKQAAEVLRKTHHRLEKVLDVETVGIMFWDFSSGCLVDANDTFLRTMGYSRHELEAGELTWQRFTPAEYHERSLAQVELFRKSGRIGPYEKEYFHKDGTRQWFVFAGSSLGGNECVEFCVDISDRKRAEQNLRATEQRLRIEKDFVETLFDVTQDTISVFEPDTGKPVRWNNACRKITGYSDEEIASLKFPDAYYSPEELALADEAIQKIYSDGTGTVELTLLTKGGKAIPFEYSGSLIPTREGEPRRFISIGRDITERKRAEQARQQREALFRAVVENTYDGILLIDKDRRIAFVSPSHKRVSGYSPEDALGSNPISYVHPDDQAHAAAALSKISQHPGQGITLEYRLRHKLGHWIWIEATVTNLLNDPYVNAFVVNSRDITERKQAELERETALGQLKKTLEGSIKAIARTIETRDPYTAGHQERVAQLAQAIAVELGLDETRIEGLGFGGLIHDIGKISVPADLLSTPRPLRPLEMELIRGHAQVGYDIIKDIDFPWPVRDMILQHHERLDGSGYPQGLKDPEILYEAKILSVADVVEAMSSHRPYRPGFGIDVALEHIRECRGTLYDAKAVDACLLLFRDKGFAFKAAF